MSEVQTILLCAASLQDVGIQGSGQQLQAILVSILSLPVCSAIHMQTSICRFSFPMSILPSECPLRYKLSKPAFLITHPRNADYISVLIFFFLNFLIAPMLCLKYSQQNHIASTISKAPSILRLIERLIC